MLRPLLLALLSCAAVAADTTVAKPPIAMPSFKPLDIGKPDHVVGTGDPASVTGEELQKALSAGGGVIVFNTGGKPATVMVTKQLELPHGSKPTVIDGMGLVTLDGGGKSRIIQKGVDTDLTVQRLRFQHARAEHEGAGIAVDRWYGRLAVIDCVFEDCKTTAPGPDLGGGAFRSPGQKTVVVSGCTFTDCAGSNGGAICSLGSQLTIVDSTFIGNVAFGTGGGAERKALGQGGIGGAVYVDGCDLVAEQKQIVVARCLFRGNRAGDHAGAMFGYTRPGLGSLSVYDSCIFEDNEVMKPKEPNRGLAGALYSQYCDLWITNCTIADNRAPLMAGGLFDPLMVSVHILNSEFYGNGSEYGYPKDAQIEHLSFAKRDHPPALDALGRMPGAIVRLEPPKVAKRIEPAPQAVAVKAPQTVDTVQLAEYQQRLRSRVLAAGARRHPRFTFAAMRQEVSVESADETGLALALPGAAAAVSVPWKALTVDDQRGLAIAMAPGGSAEDHAIAAYFLAAAGEDEQAQEQLRWAGEAGKAVAELLANRER